MRRALLVGIDDYATAPLNGCVDDVLKLQKLLLKNHDNSANFGCKTLLAPSGKSQSVTKEVLREKIYELLRSEVDMALFYFSGHGAQENSKTFLVTQDYKKHDLGVDVQDLLAAANDSPAKEIVLILDTCHSGALGQTSFTRDRTAILREGVSILTASRSNEPSLLQINGSLFTNLVCEALSGGAADVIGEVNAASIYAFLDQSLGPWDQRPLFKSHVSQLSPIRMAKQGVLPEILRELPDLFPDPDAPLQLDPSFEPDKKARPESWREVDRPENEAKFRKLQRLRDARLVVPLGEEHLFYAAVNSQACQLTTFGKLYWQRVMSNTL